MHRRQPFVPAVWPGHTGKVHRVLVTVNLHPFQIAVFLVTIDPLTEAARINSPHIPLGAAFDNPFGEDFARAATLSDAKGKDTSLKGIWYTRHRTDQR